MGFMLSSSSEELGPLYPPRPLGAMIGWVENVLDAIADVGVGLVGSGYVLAWMLDNVKDGSE